MCKVSWHAHSAAFEPRDPPFGVEDGLLQSVEVLALRLLHFGFEGLTEPLQGDIAQRIEVRQRLPEPSDGGVGFHADSVTDATTKGSQRWLPFP